MFVSTEMIACIRGILGWKNHYDLTEIPALNPTLNITESGESYQDFSPALRLDYIKSCLPANRTLDNYLDDTVKSGITQLLNDIITERKLEKYSKEILANDVILDKYGWSANTIINESRFVGFKFKLNMEIGLQMVIKNIGFQFNQIQTDLPIYVFHSSKIDPILTFNLTTTKAIEWQWLDQEIKLEAENANLVGGVWIVGYYQDDATGNAINYTEFDWSVGPCGSCNGGVSARRADHWRLLTSFMRIEPIYVPAPVVGTKGEMFDLNHAIVDYSSNWGMNFRMSAVCDLTYFFCAHKMTFKNALGLKVAMIVLNDMKYSNELNFVEQNLKHMIIRDLEGDKDTYGENVVNKFKKSVKAINFDHSRLSKHCLPCDSKRGPIYDVA